MSGIAGAAGGLTQRLRLRPFAAGDLDRLYRLYGDARVMAIRKIGTQDRAGSAAQLQQILQHWRAHGFGLWAVFDRAGGGFLGECGLRTLEDGATVEVSYGLVPEAWGRGLATEAAAAALEVAFRHLALPRVVAIARADNAASHRVMLKLGMVQTGSWPRPDGGGRVEYAIDADAWLGGDTRRCGARRDERPGMGNSS